MAVLENGIILAELMYVADYADIASKHLEHILMSHKE